VDGQGDALVGTILRAAAVRDGIAQVRTGGDLLAGSSPEREEQESRLKTRSLWRAFGLEQAPTMGAAAATDRASAIAVTLLADGDPFAAALRDCLQGLGVTEAQDAAVRVLGGTGHVVAPQRVVAIGDAALVLLQQAGFGVESMAPRHGELVRCTPADGAGAFIAARYLRRRLTDAVVLPGWDVWASDEAGAPQVLAQRERRLACLLFRPDSLLSQPAAVAMLAAAIRLCAGAD
jgi:hypothetical protein